MKRTLFCWGRAGWQKADGRGAMTDLAGVGYAEREDFSMASGVLLTPAPSELRDLGGRVFDMDRRLYSGR